MIRLVVRGFADGKELFKDRVSLEEAELEDVVPELAQKHAAAMAAKRLHMIEIEFLDEPNPEERFFRFGTDSRGMVIPVQVAL